MTKVKPITIDDLIKRLPSQAPTEARQQILQAYQFAADAHKDQVRISGESYLQHDLSVASTINQIGIDIVSTSSALLHDSLLPHTGVQPKTLQSRFGSEISKLVTGLDRLDPYVRLNTSANERNLELIRRAILTIIEDDLRIVLIRMADCLQDLRKASFMPEANQIQVAQEASNIYAPIANRLGIWTLKWEMEDLSFRYLKPEEYKEIARFLSEKREARDRSVQAAIRQLQIEIEKAGLQATVTGRPKHIYSIYRKMERKELRFDEIHDVQAVRIILDTNDKNRCYQVLGIVHNLWHPIPQQFDDYIARPKPNGYQSLHTAVIDSNGRTLEVQIRTRAMHEEAERGVAAHWAYKEGGKSSQAMNRQIQLHRELLALLQEAEGQLVDQNFISLEKVPDHIYVFTPRGDVMDLPAGSTPIDFAYLIHTEVGHRCRGAKVNGKMVSLDYKLKSGDRVEIITTKTGGPSRDWMNESLGYTGSARTRSKIRQWFREQEREQNIQQGREVVERELKRLGLANVYTVEDIAHALRYEDVDQFLAKIGFGDIQTSQIGGAIASIKQKLQPDDELLPLLTAPRSKSKGLTVLGVSGLHTRMALCCNPIAPEEIIGYITRGRGVTVHRKNCSQIVNSDEPERLIEVEWGEKAEAYPIPIVIKGYNRPGLMNDITNTLKGRGIPLTKIKSTIANSIATVYLVAELVSLSDLEWLLRKLENLPNVTEVRRQRWTG